jgi:hypothetical protein
MSHLRIQPRYSGFELSKLQAPSSPRREPVLGRRRSPISDTSKTIMKTTLAKRGLTYCVNAEVVMPIDHFVSAPATKSARITIFPTFKCGFILGTS